MDEPTLRKLLEEVRDREIAPEDAITRLRHLPFEKVRRAQDSQVSALL